MTIKIIEKRIYQNELGNNEGHHADIIISDGVTHYALGVGGLPLVGDLQPILDARFDELWVVSVVKDNQLTTRQVRRLIYNSQSAGGWDRNDYQEAVFEKDAGDLTKWNTLKARRVAIRAEWPL